MDSDFSFVDEFALADLGNPDTVSDDDLIDAAIASFDDYISSLCR